MADKNPTIYDVAERAGVSIATVSRVMGGGSASRTARQKVNDAIAELRYRPAGLLRHPDTDDREYLLVVTDLHNPYYTELCAGAEAEARKHGCRLQILCTGQSGAIDPETVRNAFARPISGAVLAGTVIESPALAEVLRDIIQDAQQRIPIVCIGPSPDWLECTSIISDLSLSVRKSIGHLTALGHKRIAFIGGSPSVRSATVRERAFVEEMNRLGLPVPGGFYHESGFTPRDGELCITKLFARTPPSEWPTAIITINDLVALGAMRQLQRMQLRIPEDVAIVGCDNQFFAPYLNPPLTTVDLHPYEHGAFAIDELTAVCNGGEKLTFSQVRECSLIVRESCGAGLGAREL